MITLWHMLMFVLLQEPIDVSGSPAIARDSEMPGVLVQRIPLEEMPKRVAGNDYVPVLRSQLHVLLENDRSTLPEMRSRIREAGYSATLNGTRLENAKLELEIYHEPHSTGSGPLLIGQTSLQQLKIFDQQGPIELGSDSTRRLFLLKSGFPGKLNGSWTSDGLVTGDVVTFRLELPAATTSRLELLTDPGIAVTSSTSLVLGPHPVPEGTGGSQTQAWTIIPGDSARLNFSCRKQRALRSTDPMPLAAFNSTHELKEDILESRWSVGLPPDLNGRTRLTARVSSRVRLEKVMLEDGRPVEWHVTEDNGQQILSMRLPEGADSATLSVTAASVLPQAESWELPMLSPIQWFSRNDEFRGPILVPIGQINVLLPRSVYLDEWILVGIQERDIVTGLDQSRTYQLTQFQQEASAIARTYSNEPRLSDSVVTLVEPTGRLATIRCLINVQCVGASVVELQWPVSRGWQVIAARYASDSRALFFEFPLRDPAAATSPLTLHLPESLEPGASRVVEIEFHQSDVTDTRTLSLPLGENRRIERTNSVLVFPPTLTLSTELQRRWSAGRRAMTLTDVRNSTTWLSDSKLNVISGGAKAKFFAVGGAESTHLAEAAMAAASNNHVIELEHAVRIVEGQIVETSRIVLPADFEFGESLTLLLPSHSAAESRWSLDGEPILAKRTDTPGSDGNVENNLAVLQQNPDAKWSRWTVSLAGRRSEVSCVLRCESRQPAGQEIMATIPMPETELPVDGTLRLYSSDKGQMSATGLIMSTASNPIDSNPDTQSTNWILPAVPEIVPLHLTHNPGIQPGQTIDVHMLHMIDEHWGGLNQQILAVANVSRSAGQDSLPLGLPTDVRPMVLVNGHRVQLRETSTGLAIPLPASSVDCQVLLTWNEPAKQAENVTGKRELPRLFLRELYVPQCTHHLLVSPQLELRAPGAEFVASDHTNVLHILNRLMRVSESTEGIPRLIPNADMPSEVRSFISRWQLAMTQDWNERTLIDSVQSDLPIVVQVTQLRRRLAIATGIGLLVVAFCVVMRDFVLEYRLTLSMVACCLLTISFLTRVSIAEALVTGTFWGLLAGLTVVTVTQWRWLHAFTPQPIVRTSVVTLLLFAAAQPSTGQEVTSPSTAPPASEGSGTVMEGPRSSGAAPDVLLPETPLPGSDVAYVKRSIFEKWQMKMQAERAALPAAVVKSLQIEIVAESAVSVELIQRMEVAAVSGDEQCHIRFPLHGSRLVNCTIDGDKVLPEPDGPDAILIPVPASSLLPTRSLSDPADDNRDDGQSSTVVDAGPLAAFTLHHIECRLRPVTTRQASGLQFVLPALPCPLAEIKLSAPQGLFTGVRAQTPAGVIQWKPADGAIRLNTLAMSEGIDIRLFQTNIENADPQLAQVEVLTIAEVVAEQPVLSCICHFSRWNPLTPEVRYQVPEGYHLLSVNSVNGGDLLWSTQERIATILLPNAIGKEFILSLQMKSDVASPIRQRRIPIAELIQFSGTVPSPSPTLLLAVRVNPVFSVLPIQDNQVRTVAFSDVQSLWGQWLRRSDSVFSVPGGIPDCVVQLTPRKSLNEVKIKQDFVLTNQQIDWTCLVDIETLVLPVFRHRLTVDSDIEITDVQVTAGESNRMASWHRRGDRLIVQLREGTTGRHILKISGRQLLRPDDSKITLRSPHVHGAQILESIMQLTDLEGLGLEFEKLGTAVPSERILASDHLETGTPVILQVLDESDTVVLHRLQAVEPVGSIAVLRDVDQAAFVVHLSQWAGNLGPLAMTFPETVEFLTEPSVIVDGRRLPLMREANTFSAGPGIIPELFNQPDFAIVWSMPIAESSRNDDSVTFAWPEISDRIQWTERLLVPLENTSGADNTAATANTTIPGWLQNSSAIGFGKDLAVIGREILTASIELSDSDRQVIVPLNTLANVPQSEVLRPLFAISDSVVWSNLNQSAVGQTTLLVFSAHPPGRCSLTIPLGTVVTEIDTSEAIRWENAARETVTVELTKPVTAIRIRWMAERAENGFASTTLKFAVPFPVECETHRSVTLASSEGDRPKFQGDVNTLPEEDLDATLLAELAAGLTRSLPDNSKNVTTADPLPNVNELATHLHNNRSRFLQGFTGNSNAEVAKAICLPPDNSRLEVFIRKRLQWQTLVSIAAAFLTVAGAAFGQTMRSTGGEPVTRTATQTSVSQRPDKTSQTGTASQPQTVESATSDAGHPTPKG